LATPKEYANSTLEMSSAVAVSGDSVGSRSAIPTAQPQRSTSGFGVNDDQRPVADSVDRINGRVAAFKWIPASHGIPCLVQAKPGRLSKTGRPRWGHASRQGRRRV